MTPDDVPWPVEFVRASRLVEREHEIDDNQEG